MCAGICSFCFVGCRKKLGGGALHFRNCHAPDCKPTAPKEKTGRTRCGARNLCPCAEGRICNTVWQRTGVGRLYVKRPGFGYDRLSNGTPPSPESIGAFRVSNKRAGSLTIHSHSTKARVGARRLDRHRPLLLAWWLFLELATLNWSSGFY